MFARHFTPTPIAFVALSLACLGLSGCAVQRAVSQAPPTVFLNSTGHARSGSLKRLPFERAWVAPKVNMARYSKIVVAPVNTDYLRTTGWSQSVSHFIPSEAAFVRRSKELAQYWDGALEKALADPKNRFAPSPDPKQAGTLVLEIALTEVVFGSPVANTASYVVPGGVVANAVLFSPSVAFEARVKNGATGKLVSTLADRRTTRLKLIDFNKFTYTYANREIIDEWCGQILRSLNPEAFPEVKRSVFSAF